MNGNQPQPQGQQKQIQIKISDEMLRGTYANAMSVVHSREEFVLDFMHLSPHQGVGVVASRVVVSPGHLKRVVAALQENIGKYEKQFGKIAEAAAPTSDIGFH